MTTALDRLEFEADRIHNEQKQQMDLSGIDFDDDDEFGQSNSSVTSAASKGRNFVLGNSARDAAMTTSSGRQVK